MMLRQVIYAVLFVTPILAGNGNNPYEDSDVNLGTLGTVISRRVADQVSGLNNELHQRLTGMNRQLQRQMLNLNRQLQTNMNSISQNVQHNLHGLSETIQQRVQQSLEPVNAMMIRSAMAQGVGGTTVAVYGDGIQLILIDGNRYTCPGEIVRDPATAGIKCTTDLVYQSPDETDVCTDSSYSRVNNIYCFGQYASFTCIDSTCQCNGGVMHTLDHLKGICGSSFGTEHYAKYDYYPDPQNTNRIPVPHPNKHVKCENKATDHCVWHGNGFVFATTEYADANV